MSDRVRFRRKLVALEGEHKRGRITENELQRRGTALVSFARSARPRR